MNLREQIVDKVERLPENFLPEVENFLEQLADESELNALAKLRRIRISAAPDFSTTAEIYSTTGENE